MRAGLFLAAAGFVSGAAVNREVKEKRQNYFQTTPEVYAGVYTVQNNATTWTYSISLGPTPTGSAAFLAQTNPAPFAGTTYVAPAPLETQVPIQGAGGNSIFQHMGQLSHYFPNPAGFGVQEYSLPDGANITWLNMLSRHGARYPTATASVVGKLQNNTFKATGVLSFLNSWTYVLGEQILVPVGKSELFESGTLHQYLYGQLYPNNGSKIVARSTTQDRMLQSSEYFLAGFFGLGWTQNASIEPIIEQTGFNNSLAAYFACPNALNSVSTAGSVAAAQWQSVYLAAATKRLNNLITFTNKSISLSVADVYNMQSLCAYETVALGYSSFCQLYTYNEWLGYEYAVDISFAGNDAFQSPTGRAVGIGYVQEIRARLTHQYLTANGGSSNITLDSMPLTFPLDQALNFDFSHDTNIMAILTAWGFTQFAQFLPTTNRINHNLVVSHMEPFGARLDIELIQTPSPLSPHRGNDKYLSGSPTTYIHFILNQRTLPLGYSFPTCGKRDDGWCELGTFLDATADAYELSNYNYACYGNYSMPAYGTVNNGNPSTFQAASNIYNGTSKA